MVVEENQNQIMDAITGYSATTASTSEDEAEESTTNAWKTTKELLILHLSKKLLHGDLDFRIEAAREIRKLLRKSPLKSSARSKLADAGVIPPLVPMLISSNLDACHASLLALLHLAVRNERNKIEIVKAGAVPPLIQFLKLTMLGYFYHHYKEDVQLLRKLNMDAFRLSISRSIIFPR